jgi:hypothetical protein
MRLIGWAVVDAQGHVTRVNLGPLAAIAPPAPDFFSQASP